MSEVLDTGTREFVRKHRVVPVKMRASVLVRVLDSTAIDRALVAGHVDPEQHSVLVAFNKDCYLACLLGPRASDYGRPMGSGVRHETSQKEAEALQRVGKAIDFLDQSAGRQVRESLLKMILEEKDLPAATVKMAAEGLVKFYLKFTRSP